jgi:CHASE2 domain-containing sensor protein
VLRSKTTTLFAASVLQTLFWVLVLVVDPFGMSNAADRASESIFLKLYAAAYPDVGRDQIKVVIIDEDDLPLYDGGSPQWPLQFDNHVKLIEEIRKLRPKGVFVDILFDTTQNRNPDVMATYAASLNADGKPPVVFASYAENLPRTSRRPALLIEPLQDLPYGNSPSDRASRGLVEMIAVSNHYALADEAGLPSAAAALYQVTGNKINTDERDTILAWGYLLPNRYRGDAAAYAEKGCVPFFDGDGRAEAFVTTVFSGALRNLGLTEPTDRGVPTWEVLQPCTYHQQINARAFFDAGDKRDLRRAIRDSYVLIGTTIDGSGDTVDSPLHGQLPGVYSHAMALDNLLSLNGKPLIKADQEWLQAGLIFLCVFLGGLAFGAEPSPTSRGAAFAALAARGAAWLVAFAVVVFMVVAFLLEFSWAPYNWGGVLAIAGVSLFAGSGRIISVLVRGAPVQAET